MTLKQKLEPLKGDIKSIIVLFVLYTLQGIPIGVSSTIQILLQQQHSSYNQQALFSLCSYPYAMKMLWAPIVDTVYNKRIGKRKSWIVPLQLIVGVMMIAFSSVIENTLYSDNPNVVFLTICFFVFYFLVATQDIAVDGWALTLLSEKNKGYGSTCNVIGQTLGIQFASSIFLALHEPRFLSSWRGKVEPMVTVRQLLSFWGLMFIGVTLFILFYVDENKKVDAKNSDQEEEEEADKVRAPLVEKEKEPTETVIREENLSVRQVYQIYLRIIKNPYFIILATILFTNRLGVYPVENATSLRLIDKGMKRVALTSFKLFYFPVEMLVTIKISSYMKKAHPMKVWMKGYICRVILAFCVGNVIHYLPDAEMNEMNSTVYPLVFTLLILTSISQQLVSVSGMVYFSHISDSRYGGTYMSLFNTVSNLGGTLFVSPSLSLIDLTSRKACYKDGSEMMKSCISKEAFNQCASQGGKCVTLRDGFYVMAWPSFFYGIIWLLFMRKRFDVLEVREKKTIHPSKRVVMTGKLFLFFLSIKQSLKQACKWISSLRSGGWRTEI